MCSSDLGNVDSVTADVEAQRIAALLAQDQYDQSYGLSEAQLKLSQGDALAAQVLSLYDNKLITKKQAQQYLDFSSETGFDEFFNKYYGLA